MQTDDWLKEHISQWMVDDGNNKLLWKDKAPTPNEILDLLSQQREQVREEERKEIAKQLNLTLAYMEKKLDDGEDIDWWETIRAFIRHELLK